MLAFDKYELLSELEEIECEDTINSLLRADSEIDYYLWRLKYEIFCDGRKHSKKLGSFEQTCRHLQREHNFFATQTCYDRALAQEERRIIKEELQINISHIKKPSVYAMLELRKVKELAEKKLVLARALEIVKKNCSNQLTANDIKNALSEIKQEIELPTGDSLVLSPVPVQLKLIDENFIDEELAREETKQKPSRVGQVYRLYVSGVPDAHLNLGEIFDPPQCQIKDEFLEFKIVEDTSAESDTSRNSNQSHNQGFNFYNSQIYSWKGMRFRSQVEIIIAHALDCQDVMYLPNCIARFNNSQGVRTNKEPDFFVIHHGKTGILEIDGPHHIPERRVLEQERERLFRLHGVRIVERYEAQRCKNKPHDVVREFLQLLAMS